MSRLFRRHKRTFNAGEVSPLISMLTDNARYKNGCKTLLNMVTLSQGPARRRSGTRFVFDLTTILGGTLTDTPPKKVPFVFDENQAYSLVFFKHNNGNTRVVFCIDNGLVEDPLSPGTPYVFEFSGTMDLNTFSYEQSADTLVITQPTRMPIIFQRLAHDEWQANEVSMTEQPFVLNTDSTLTITPSATTGSGITLTASASLFTVDFVDLEMKVNGGRVNIVGFTDDTHVTADVTIDLEDTTARADWYTTEWSPVNGYPRFATFFEQRIVYGSNTARPQTIWCSKSGDYYDFGKSSPIVASDALTFTLDSGSQNKIQWMASARKLLVGTLGDEWTVSGGGYEPLSFQTVQAARHTNDGAENLKALMIGPVTLFLRRLGTVVNQYVFDYNKDSYITVDLSVLAPHLTESNTIIDWDYQQTPNGIVWCVRDDGTMIALTFKREHNVTGWHRHTTESGDGLFKTVACIPGGEKEDEVWVVVERVIGGVSKWYIEVMAPEFKSGDMEDARFLDSHLVYDGAATTSVSGLGHLEGKDVDVVGDGAYLGTYEVTGGNLVPDLERAKSHVVVGLPYTSELRPYFDDVPLDDGTLVGKNDRITHVDVFVHNSIGFSIGREDQEEGELMNTVPFRRPSDIMSDPVPVFNGVKHVVFSRGYSRDIDLIIRQTQPLPLTVLGLVDHIAIGDD